ncbi:MAG TPA: hypothetical protein VHF89_03690 [Solirubrobacteraceae bacterium]|nr:hypothetical protein [Solirubrobacteraceae bacterium]
MFTTRLSARRLARKLLLLPVLVAALVVVIVPAPAAPKWDNPGNGSWAVQSHQPYGVGDGRKIK